jgi:predicted porin
MQKRKLLAAAVSAALIIPGAALAQKRGGSSEGPEPDSVVELYGKVYPEIVVPDSSGATSPSASTVANSSSYSTLSQRPTGENAVIRKTEMESSNSRFGVRGSERLGGDLRAIFQLETQFLLDNNNTGFAQRDSFVGLKSNTWGTIKLGRMDTPFKEFGDDLAFLGVSSGNFTSTSNINRHIGFGPSNNAARFHERRVNVAQYETPEWHGTEFKIQWSTNEAKTDVAPIRDPRVLSMGGAVQLGDFKLMGGYEIHYDLFGLSLNSPTAYRNTNDPNVRSKDEAAEVALQWKIGGHTIEVDANQLKYDEPGAVVTGRVRSYKKNAYMLLWEWRLNNQFRTAFQYIRSTPGTCTRVNADCNTNGMKAEQIGLGFAYHFSRKTYLFVMGTLLKNDYAASFSNSNQQSVNPGEDIRQIGVGLHTAW